MISSPQTLVFGGLVGGYHENSVHGRSAPSGTCSAYRRSRWPASRAYLSQVLGSGGLDRGRSEKSKKAAAHGPQGRCRQVCRVGRRQARILVFRLRRGHRLLCYPIPRRNRRSHRPVEYKCRGVRSRDDQAAAHRRGDGQSCRKVAPHPHSARTKLDIPSIRSVLKPWEQPRGLLLSSVYRRAPNQAGKPCNFLVGVVTVMTLHTRFASWQTILVGWRKDVNTTSGFSISMVPRIRG